MRARLLLSSFFLSTIKSSKTSAMSLPKPELLNPILATPLQKVGVNGQLDASVAATTMASLIKESGKKTLVFAVRRPG